MKTKFKVGDKVRIKPSEIKTGFKNDEYYIGERYMDENEILELNKDGSYTVKAEKGIMGHWDVCENQLELISKYKIYYCFLDKNNAVQTDEYGCEMYYNEEIEAKSQKEAIEKFNKQFIYNGIKPEIVEIIRR